MFAKFTKAFPVFFPRIAYWELRQVFPLIVKLIASGRLVRGEEQKRLTTLLREHFSVPDVALLNSGTIAIELALEAFKQAQPERKSVILPVYVCQSVIRAIHNVHLKPRFVAVRQDLTIGPADLRHALDHDVLAVLIPHIYGYPASIAECVDIVHQWDPSVFIIDDAAPAFDTTADHRKLGTWGDVGILSFAPAKKLTATGGGALLISNDDILEGIRKHLKTLSELPKRDVFRKFVHFWWAFVCIRYSLVIDYWSRRYLKLAPQASSPHQATTMCNMDAALILRQLAYYKDIHAQRNRIMEYYMQGLKDIPQISFPQPEAPSFDVARFYMRVDGLRVSIDRNGAILRDNPLVAYLERHGIRAGYGYTLLEKDLGTEGMKLRQEQYAWLDELILLPIDHKQKIDRYNTVIKTIHSFFETRRTID
jgi:dTDP-4-amino-4,6-dideoxygalactose transaminase